MIDDPSQFLTLLREAGALNAVAKYQEAIVRSQSAAALNPDDPRPYCEWSRALLGLERYDEALGIAQRATQVSPLEPWGFRLVSIANTNLAKGRSKANRVQLGTVAVAAAQEAVRLAPHDLNGFVCLAQSWSLQGNMNEADAAIQEAIRIDPRNTSVWVTASLVAIRARNWNAAESASRNALAIEPGNFAALNNLGVALNQLGRRREGTEAIANSARARPDSKTARQNLSRSGLNVARITIMVLLIPIGFIAHVGFGLYFVFNIVSFVVIAKNPEFVLRMERWAAPVALFIFRRPKKVSVPDERLVRTMQPPSTQSPHSANGAWSALTGRHRIRTPIILFFAVITGLTGLFFLIFVPIVQSNARGAVVFCAAFFLVISLVLASKVRKRRRTLG